ncbi:MAG: SOUL family heme-binding protein [Chloroflexota bacterium]
MTEQQEYRVLETRGIVELREYAPHVVATVLASGSPEAAASEAFRPLFGYISGVNLRAAALAMTAPVIQEPAGERLPMTAPVIHRPAGVERWAVSFVLPGGRGIEGYPEPTDLRVSLRAVPREEAAALGWSGSWTAENVARWTEELRRRIAEAGWQEAGEARWARFDPPMRPPSQRRNEIVIPVTRVPRAH